MFEFLENLSPLNQGFWYIALATSLVFVVQTVLTFVGGDSDGINSDFDGEFHTDTPFELFSLRNLINFLLGFGWSGVAFYKTIGSQALLVIISVVIGLGFVVLFFFLIAQIMKLTEDNTFKVYDLIGHTGEVYLTIPEKMQGKGKIQISLNGTSHELQAMTESDEKLSSGTAVRVIYISDKTLIVAKI